MQKFGILTKKKRAGQENSGQVRPCKQRLSVARALSSLEIAGRNQNVIDHRGGQIFEGGIGLRGCWYHRIIMIFIIHRNPKKRYQTVLDK